MLVRYGNNYNSLRVWEWVQRRVCHSNRKNLDQSLLFAIHKFSESEQ